MPPEFLTLIIGFQPLFSHTVFEHATVLLVGAILAPGARTITNCLRMMGLHLDPHYQKPGAQSCQVVGPSDCPDDAVFVGSVFARYADGRWVAARAGAGGSASGLVSKDGSKLQ